MLIETVAVRHGIAPLWDLHLTRMTTSADALGLPAPDLERPAGGPDRILRLLLARHGLSVKQRDLGAQGPIQLATVEVVHQPYPHKTVQRAVFDQALSEAQAAGGDEPLLLSGGGFVAETARFAIIWEEDDGTIGGPPLDLGILPGVGRSRVAELCGGITERPLDRTALEGRPVALVNAVRGLIQVSSLDGTKVPQSALLDRVAGRFWP